MTDDNTQRILDAIDRLEIKVDRLESNVDRLEIKVDRLESNVDRLESKVDRLESNVDRLESKVDRLETRVDGLDINAGRLETKVDTMRADIMERIDRVQHTVDLTRDDIIVNFGNTDRVERVARGAIDDNRTTTEILRTMQRQIMRLQTDVAQLKGPP